MLFSELITVYSENRMKYIITLHTQNTEFWIVQVHLVLIVRMITKHINTAWAKMTRFWMVSRWYIYMLLWYMGLKERVDEEFCLLGYNAMHYVECQPTFGRNVLLPSSELKSIRQKYGYLFIIFSCTNSVRNIFSPMNIRLRCEL
jgi:hypothetical protein